MSVPAHDEPRSTFERVLARRTDDLSQRQAERATELVQQGTGQRDRRRRVTLARVAGAALGLLFLRLVFGGTPGRRGNEPIGAGAVATADGAGVGSSASAFLPQSPARALNEPTPAPSASLGTGTPVVLSPAAGRAPLVSEKAAPRPPAPTVPAARAATPSAVADSTHPDSAPALFAAADAQVGGAGDIAIGAMEASGGAQRAATSSTVINVGTRLHAKLEAALRTGSTFAPATATLAEDLRDGERVLLKAGTRLVGNAFATPNDDRVQIVWRALVHDGRTLNIQAETLGPDGGAGLRGKVIRRHHRGVFRRVTSTLASTAGEVAGAAVPLGDTALEQASAALAGRAGRELGQLGGAREWSQADTVVELKAGTPIVVYVSADIALGQAGAR